MLFIEHATLYQAKGEVPDDEDFIIPIGESDVKREGNDVTIVSYSKGLQLSLEAAEKLAQEGISAEVIDLRTLRPLDTRPIVESVKKTNRMVVVEEGWRVLRHRLRDRDPGDRAGVRLPGRPRAPGGPGRGPAALQPPPGTVRSAPGARHYQRREGRHVLEVNHARFPALQCGGAGAGMSVRGGIMAELITMPKLGFDMAEGKLSEWLKKPGEAMRQNETILLVETDKATVEVPAFRGGVLLDILVQAGESVPIGTPVAVIGEQGEKYDPAGAGSDRPKAEASRRGRKPSRPKPVPAAAGEVVARQRAPRRLRPGRARAPAARAEPSEEGTAG